MNRIKLKKRLQYLREHTDRLINEAEYLDKDKVKYRVYALNKEMNNILNYANSNGQRYKASIRFDESILNQINDVVANHFNISDQSNMWIKSRHLEILLPRQVSQFFMMEATDGMATLISRFWGQNHANSMHSRAVIWTRIEFEKNFYERYIQQPAEILYDRGILDYKIENKCIGRKKTADIL
jgi:chromosomal replication initiation ATPase DnaA